METEVILALIVLPLLIFLARVLDVSLATIRIMFISKGFKHLAPIIGFFQIFIWLLAIGQIFQNLTNVIYYIAYAGGFATGTYLGMYLEGKLSIGTQIVRIITVKNAQELADALRSGGYEVTYSEANGIDGRVMVIYCIIDRHDLPAIIDLIKKYNPNAFYSIEDVKLVSEKITQHRKPWYDRHKQDMK